MVKAVSYSHTNSYHIVNPIVKSTARVWIAFHGLGYLARYFSRYFKELDPSTDTIIVLQAPSKFYLDKRYKNVGACWLTRVDTQLEMKNNLNYIREVLLAENLLADPRLIFMGYSQGVSIAMRSLLKLNLKLKALIMHSGSIPDELTVDDGNKMRDLCDTVIHISGLRDEYATDEIRKRELEKIKKLFGTQCEIHTPDIKHEVDVNLITSLAHQL